MTYRVYDESVLETSGKFDLSLDISSEYNVPNPDGSNPVLTLAVDAPTLRVALVTLSQLGENDASAFLEVAVRACALEAGIADPHLASLETIISDEGFQNLFDNRERGFFTIPLESTVELASGETVKVSFAVTAPSYRIAYSGFASLSSQKRLNALMASFMPEDDDYYDSDY